ncbi:NUDIX domain-containing protein [Cryobacterium sp. BB307]|uniref:NUDIX domain-containing protein n=1 Tax=Cryobacterium sp. BB307 TaxID=2716317 RepID=UPI001445308F
MAETSAGLLLYRRTPAIEVFIAHMGGPFWAKKDDASWSVPKGLYDDGEAPLAAAMREFEEEIGTPAPDADYQHLGQVRMASGKIITVFTAEADFEVDRIESNTFALEWPPHSGRIQEFPEIDDARWFTLDGARAKLVKSQRPLLDQLERRLA